MNEASFFIDEIAKKGIRQEKLSLLERIWQRLHPLVGPEGKKTISLGYVEFAAQYLKQDNKDKAKECLKQALGSNPDDVLSMDIYGKRVIQVLFASVISDKEPDKTTLDRAFNGLELAYPAAKEKALKATLQSGYQLLLGHYERLGDISKVDLIKERLSSLSAGQ